MEKIFDFCYNVINSDYACFYMLRAESEKSNGGKKSMSKKYCYLFTEGDASMRELLGGKGANLAEMTKIGLPVP